MDKSNFSIGLEFYTASGHWRCTDIGSRVVVAIPIDLPFEIVVSDGKTTHRKMTHDASWFRGPPYAVAERVFDEDSIAACTLKPQTDRSPASALWG